MPEGTYPIRLFTENRGIAQYATTADANIVATNSGGKQTQTYTLPIGTMSVRLLGANDTVPARHFGNFLDRLVLFGLTFDPEFPVAWRETNAAGVVVPNQPWTWSIRSSEGNVTLTQTSQAFLPEVEIIAGIPTSVQRIETALTLTGGASGTVQMTFWEAVGDSARKRLRMAGGVTFAGQTTPIDFTAVIGGLSGQPLL